MTILLSPRGKCSGANCPVRDNIVKEIVRRKCPDRNVDPNVGSHVPTCSDYDLCHSA